MIRALLKLTASLLALALIGFVLTGVWVVYTGTHDDFDHADVALVPGYGEIHDGAISPALAARLERVATLYAAGKFPNIIVSGVTPPNEDDEADAMAQYLKIHQVPASAIIEDHRDDKTGIATENLLRIMQDQKFHSLLLAGDYYKLAHLKLVLQHAGIREVELAYVGEWKREDALDVLKEDIAIFKDLYHWYLIPAAAEVSDKARAEAQKAKESVDQKIDSIKK